MKLLIAIVLFCICLFYFGYRLFLFVTARVSDSMIRHFEAKKARQNNRMDKLEEFLYESADGKQ